MMQRYGTLGQWIWLTIGGWTGAMAQLVVFVNLQPLRRFEADFLLPLVVVAAFPLVALATMTFPVWHAALARHRQCRRPLVWWIPFALGIPLNLAMSGVFYLFESTAGLERARSIVAFAGFALLVLPVLAAEACLRLSREGGVSADKN